MSPFKTVLFNLYQSLLVLLKKKNRTTLLELTSCYTSTYVVSRVSCYVFDMSCYVRHVTCTARRDARTAPVSQPQREAYETWASVRLSDVSSVSICPTTHAH